MIAQHTSTPGKGVYCSFGGHLRDNVIRNYANGWSGCSDSGGNVAD